MVSLEMFIMHLYLFIFFPAVRSGDYYMFEDYEDDLDLISEKSGDSGVSEYSDEQVDVRRTSVSQVFAIFIRWANCIIFYQVQFPCIACYIF